jgi:hypothetical protein
MVGQCYVKVGHVWKFRLMYKNVSNCETLAASDRMTTAAPSVYSYNGW